MSTKLYFLIPVLLLGNYASRINAQNTTTHTNLIEGEPLPVDEPFVVEIPGLWDPLREEDNDGKVENDEGGVVANLGPQEPTFHGSDVRLILSMSQRAAEPVPVGVYKVLVEVNYYKESPDDQPDPFSHFYELSLETDPGGGVHVPTAAEIQDAWKIEVTVRGITFDGNPLEGETPPMQLIGEITEKGKDRCIFSTAMSLDPVTFRNFVLGEDGRGDLVVDEQGKLEAVVPAITCADEYDLEYVFYDMDSDVGHNLTDGAGGGPLDDLFRNNATRLTSTSEIFRLFNLYREGYLIVRYRAVHYSEGDIRTYTRWSNSHKSVPTDEEDYVTSGIIKGGHQQEYNWQATTNFAEEAKQLPSISYMDGTMRGRQNLVLQYWEVNGEPRPDKEYAIGQQTIYDAMGRPAVSVLPAPIYPRDMNDGLHPLRFDPAQLIKPTGQDKSNPSYKLYGTDQVEAEGECAAETVATDAGAGKFYSPENTKVDGDNAFVPDAHGYPFAVTRYTPDNTGRVRRQGGVGPELQVGNHDTKYFYGTVEQRELDRLFGVNVGNAKHYQKTMVIDPNGQASISYLDAKGRTVATALAGAAPPNLIPINRVDAGFAYEGDEAEPTTVHFENKSRHANTYEWNFADLGTSTEENPTFSFPELGTYVVCLTATGPTGQEQYCQYVSVSIEPDYVEDVVELKKGFNLVSFDVAPADNRITRMLADLIEGGKLLYVQGRNSDGGLELFNPRIKEKSVLQRLAPGRGYMIGVTEDVTLTVEGEAIDPDFRPTLHAGVNLLGYLPEEPVPVDQYVASLIPSEGNLTFIRTFVDNRFVLYRPDYHEESPFEMENGRAYEVFIGSAVEGEEWLSEYGGDNGEITGTVYGQELYTTSNLDRDPLLIGNENDLSSQANDGEFVPDDAPRVVTDMTNNIRYADRVETTYSLLVPQTDLYDICYALEVATYDSGCCPRVPAEEIPSEEPPGDFPRPDPEVEAQSSAAGPTLVDDCFECYYDVTVRIQMVGLCDGGEFTPPDPIVIDNELSYGEIDDCFADEARDLSGILLEVGEYVITKTVTVHQPAVDAAVEEFMATARCVQTEESFIDQYVAQVDLSGCEVPPCDCEDADKDEICAAFCGDPISPTSATYEILLEDVSPGGQYANYKIGDDGSIVQPPAPGSGATLEAKYKYSIFAVDPNDAESRVYQTITYADELETANQIRTGKKIGELTVQEFIDNFRPEWAEYLVEKIHPEFTVHTWNETNLNTLEDGKTSHQFDDYLRELNTYLEASGKYGKHDLSGSGVTVLINAIADKDPFLTRGGRVFNFIISDPVRGKNSGIQTAVHAHAAQLFGEDRSWDDLKTYERDIVWQLVRDLYLGRKGIYVDIKRKEENMDAGSAEWTELKWRCLTNPMCGGDYACKNDDCDEDIPDTYVARMTSISDVEVTTEDVPETVDELYDRDSPFYELITKAEENGRDQCDDRCSQYAVGWRNTLMQCPAIAQKSEADINEIIAELTAICEAGCAGGKLLGSSTVPANVIFTGNGTGDEQRTTFAEVIAYYLGTEADCTDPACQPTVISFPPPADRDYYGGTVTIPRQHIPLFWVLNKGFLTSRMQFLRSGCACSTCDNPPAPKSLSGLGGVGLENMARLNRMTVTELERSLNLIGALVDGTADDDIFTDAQDLILPAELTPGGQYCVYKSILEKHRQDFAKGSTCTDDDNTLLAQHLNAKLGWNRPWRDYALVLEGDDNCMICADPPAAIAPRNEPPGCAEELAAQARFDARIRYEEYVDRRAAAFRQEYTDNCLDNVNDRLKLRYAPREYHYTLYYYDQAGNLTMTVPPEGVEPLAEDDYAGVAKYRDEYVPNLHEYDPDDTSNPRPVVPPHTMLTHYRYNSFNEVTVSDAPDKAMARTWYNRLGQPTLSRDGRQTENGLVSYTLYDNLGRPYEVGELDVTSPGKLSQYIIRAQQTDLEPLLRDNRNRFHVTRTFYTTSAPLAYRAPDIDPFTLRNRVAAVTYQATPPPLADGEDEDQYYYQHYDFASHYRYDIAGNVSTLIQDFADLPADHRYKRLDYTYDLISGNVHYLHYQKDRPDQFTYYYEYDKLNRLATVFTSEFETDHAMSNLWKREAAYTYYDHGPLKRTVLGQDRLQGLDYAYTLQGWIKGVNGSLGDDYTDVASPDMNMDGRPEQGDYLIDRVPNIDLYRYANQYFDGDYTPINAGVLNPFDNVLPPDYELFNGNIVRHYKSTVTDGFRTAALVGEYDQLHRLRYGRQEFYGGSPLPDPPRGGGDATLTQAVEAPTYDGNGNIRSLQRFFGIEEGAGEGTAQNQLNYTYGNGKDGTNLLTMVTARAEGPALNADWQPFDLMEGEHVYDYDKSGNLHTETTQAGVTTIAWNPYGKVSEVNHPEGETQFGYGPDQQRWAKHRIASGGERSSTYYVRDAQGNTLATYGADAGANTPPSGGQGGDLTWKEQYLYGSSRLGEVAMNRELTTATGISQGARRYELTNHLGNVTTTFGEGVAEYDNGLRVPMGVRHRDYFAFGLALKRSPNDDNFNYRYSFNSKEIDNDGEWGGQSHIDYGFRIYNPAVARFLSVDPLSPDYPWYTPYQFAGNTPIQAIDVDGLEPGHKYQPTPTGYPISTTKYTDPQTRATQRGKNTVMKIFQNSGGYRLYEKLYPKFMSSGNFVYHNAALTPPAERFKKFELPGGDFTEKEAVNFMLGNMVTGRGPEEVIYSSDSPMSHALDGSAILIDALGKFRKMNEDYINGGSRGEISDLLPEVFKFHEIDLFTDIMTEQTVYTIEGFIGSGTIGVEYDSDRDLLNVTIRNVTSLTSGDYAKDLGYMPAESLNRENGERNRFRNIKQTFNLQFKLSDVFPDRKSPDSNTKIDNNGSRGN